MYDFIVVGQGLAGTLFSYTAQQQGYRVFVIDQFKNNTASYIANGVVNPITGRKMVKTWMADELIPYARTIYQKLEKEFSVNLIKELSLKKIFSSPDDSIIWNKKRQLEEYKLYLSETKEIENNSINAPFGVGIIAQSFWLNSSMLLDVFRHQVQQQNCLLSENFEFSQLEIGNTIRYKNIEANYIVFCEGYTVQQNPFFNFIPIQTTKGELLTIYSESLQLEDIINKNIFIIPLGNNLYSIGSTYIWNDIDEQVTTTGRNEIINKLNKIIKTPYTITHEIAGIRPTIKDRRPVLGTHFKHKNLFVFNGLGTKGISLAPYFANHLLCHITQQQSILKEVCIDRFLK